jgi:flagellar L-ring protein precursor FlgH
MLCVMLVMLMLSGCQSAHNKPLPKEDDSLSWAQEAAPTAANGAIYQTGRDVALFESPIARHVGDIVTIVLNEATAAKKSATTTTTKNTDTTLPGMTILGKQVTIKGNPILNNDISDANKFAGEGDSAQSNSLTGFIQATVIRVLPNGNMLIRGEKQIWINQGSEYVRLEGVIRPIDLAADNSVNSQKVAGARISYGGKGALADANAQGWLSRFFNSPWTPF